MAGHSQERGEVFQRAKFSGRREVPRVCGRDPLQSHPGDDLQHGDRRPDVRQGQTEGRGLLGGPDLRGLGRPPPLRVQLRQPQRRLALEDLSHNVYCVRCSMYGNTFLVDYK